jgi:hypothetical protein
MEAIAMKCTQEQFDEIKHLLNYKLIGNFESLQYLATDFGGEIGLVSNVGNFLSCDHGYNTRYIEVWDRKVFLEALDIPQDEILFCHIREYFKDTIEGLSLRGCAFKIGELGLSRMFIKYDIVYIGDIKEYYRASLYDIVTKKYATITKTKTKNMEVEEIWDSNSIQFRTKGDLEWQNYGKLNEFVEFRKKPKPDNSKAIAQLEEEIERSKTKVELLKWQMR